MPELCGMSLLLVLVPAPRVLFVVVVFLWGGGGGRGRGYAGFLPSTKTNIPKFQFDLETVDERASLWKPVNTYLS